jgi:hypothetical protein
LFPAGLFLQISQPFFHRLDLETQVRQIGFQFLNLLSLGLEPAREMTAAIAVAIASTAARAPASAIAGVILAVTFFFVRHIYLQELKQIFIRVPGATSQQLHLFLESAPHKQDSR